MEFLLIAANLSVAEQRINRIRRSRDCGACGDFTMRLAARNWRDSEGWPAKRGEGVGRQGPRGLGKFR